MISIIKDKRGRQLIVSILLALTLWQLGAMLFEHFFVMGRFLVATPAAVLGRLLSLWLQLSFWRTVWFSFIRIVAGFLAALTLGSLLAVAAGRFPLLETLFWPYLTVIKATPVASFIILCLIWWGSRNLSIIISFLMVLPVIYTNMLQGIRSADRHLLEMAAVFRAGWGRRLVYIYLPQLKPYLLSACSLALGMTWKSGIAAEVIGIPSGSIGEMLYQAKVYLNAQELFAWTAVVILISAAFEKLFMAGIKRAYQKLERLGRYEGAAAEPLPAPGLAPGSTAEAAPALAPLPDIEVRGLCKAYGNKEVLRDYSAVFPGGSCICIMGDSGVGKTTLLHILMGLVQQSAGVVTGLEGLRISAVFQEDRLCESFNAIANVGFACGRRLTAAVIAAHLTALGLGDSMNQPVGELSGGMRRRVAIVRGVLAGGQVLFLDEPLKGLDEQNKEITAAYIRRYSQGVTTLMVTHSQDEVALMGGRLLVLKQEQDPGRLPDGSLS
jgi:NitT/TauT family transport system permease protein